MKSSNISEIVREIRSGQFTNSEIDQIAQAVRFARAQLAHDIKQELTPGARVRFSNRRGQTVTGTVDSIKIKNAVVTTSLGRYRVPCNMLTLETA